MRFTRILVVPFWPMSLGLQPFALSLLQENGNYTSVVEAFPQLAGFELDLKSPRIGEQNFTHCCLRAVDESLVIWNGYVEKSSTDYMSNSTIDELFEARDNGYFPCDADSNEAYKKFVVQVPYAWLSKNCPGWSRVPLGSLSWVQSLVSFVLPAVVFCLSIPRRQKLKIPDRVFGARLSNVIFWIALPFLASCALLFAIFDTIFWLGCCLSFASPMLLSALYEAYLDYNMVGVLKSAFEDTRIHARDKAAVLFAILIGNLDITIGHNDDSNGNGIPLAALNSAPPNNVSTNTSGSTDHDNLLGPGHQTDIGAQSAWRHMTDLIDRELGAAAGTPNNERIELMRTRLLTMLEGQYSFGATVGAPVVFFMGGFIVALLSATTDPMDNTASLALAFAMWYTVIPHLAIVQGLLLAANNPSIFASIVGAGRLRLKGRHFTQPAYPSIFKPVSLWERGPNKAAWLKRVARDYFQGDNRRYIQRAFGSRLNQWVCMIGGSLALLTAPFILAFITAYETPVVGLSCRSLTFLVHFSGQVALGILWAMPVLWNTERPIFSLANVIGSPKPFFKSPWIAVTTAHGQSWKRFWVSLIWSMMIVISGTISLFCAIAGTIMQLIGVYSGDICYVTVKYWGKPHELSQFLVTISQNDPLAIKQAYVFWLTCGSIGTALLGLVTFFGWWYSKRVRVHFTALVEMLN